jgi:DNA-binding LytR/AlgR family response regulator
MFKSIIIEDNPFDRNHLEYMIKNHPKLELLGSFISIEDFESTEFESDIHVFFVDINLPIQTGLEFARNYQQNSLIILTTAYAEHAVTAYALNVFDYLLKPISNQRLDKSIDKIEAHFNFVHRTHSDENIIVLSNGKNIKINSKEISHIEGFKDYVKIHTSNGIHFKKQTLRSLDKDLGSFIRVHKSFLVNKQFIYSYLKNSLNLTSGEEIPIGRKFKPQVKDLFKQ